MEDEVASQWVGPMPVKEFMKAFVDVPNDILNNMPKFEPDCFDKLARSETQAYDQFIAGVNSSSALPGFMLVNTFSETCCGPESTLKNQPTISCYLKEVELGPNVASYKDMELMFQFQPFDEPADPFDDDARKPAEELMLPFEVEHIKSEKCRAQLSCLIQMWCSRQHRIHCFIIWVGDPGVRLIRLDRSGGIVSAWFDYRKEGHLLLEFIWKICQLTAEARGRDPTFSEASPDEACLAKEALREWTPSTEKPVFKLQIPDPLSATKYRPFLVWRSLAGYQNVTGRGTGAYPAFDVMANGGKGAVVFVKDSWRSSEGYSEKESEILKDLNDKKCQNVPQLICGDDLLDQSTKTKAYAKESWNIGAVPEDLVNRVHIRFAQDLIGYDIETFKFNSSKEFLQAIYDAAIAHREAYEKCRILHCDVSGGNILLRKEGGGFLNDWDLAKRVDKDVGALQPFRVGTWHFMSAELLMTPDKRNSLPDDLESFFWIILYYALRYLRHNRMENLEKKMVHLFEEEVESDLGKPICGGHAKLCLLSGRYPLLRNGFTILQNKPMTHIILTLVDEWQKWYLAVDCHLAIVSMANKAQLEDDIPRDEAHQTPFDDSSLNMRDHAGLLTPLEDVLNLQAWPKNDQAFDNFSLEMKWEVKL